MSRKVSVHAADLPTSRIHFAGVFQSQDMTSSCPALATDKIL